MLFQLIDGVWEYWANIISIEGGRIYTRYGTKEDGILISYDWEIMSDGCWAIVCPD